MDIRVRPPRGGLLAIMGENTRKLGEIRKLCGKVAAIRNMGQVPVGVRFPLFCLISRCISLLLPVKALRLMIILGEGRWTLPINLLPLHQ